MFAGTGGRAARWVVKTAKRAWRLAARQARRAWPRAAKAWRRACKAARQALPEHARRMREDADYQHLVDEVLHRLVLLPGLFGKLGRGLVVTHRFVVMVA